MTALLKLQQAFAADLWGDDLNHLQGLILDDNLSAARRFNVYRNNFQSSLIDALAAIYPVVEQLVGREFFGHMADRFIRAHPSRSGNLHQLGSALAVFLERLQAVSHLPYLADVARLDWAYHTVFHAGAPLAFEAQVLEQVAAENYEALRFSLGPACRLVRSMYPIFSIWKVNQADYVGDKTVNLDAGPESVLVVRPEMEVELWRLDAANATFLSALESGSSLVEAVEVSLQCSHDFNLQAALARYLSSGVLTCPADQAPLCMSETMRSRPG